MLFGYQILQKFYLGDMHIVLKCIIEAPFCFEIQPRLGGHRMD